MTASTEPRGGLDLGWSSGEDGWGDAMNANLLRLSRLGFHPSVLSATTTAPPGSPISGSGYIIPSGATGAWAGKTGQVAVWDGAAWAYAAPRDGWTMHVDGAGLTTYYNGIWSQANVVTAAGVGAEPYAGVPATTSLWRSTAAGVRAWVQLVAADITDLATTLAGYLTKANPTFTGTLTGPTAAFAGLTGTGNRPLVAGADGTIDDQDAAAFRGTIGAAATDHNHTGTYLPVAGPNFTGNLLQDGDQRITPSGGGRFTDLSLATLAAGSDLPMVSDAAGVLRNKSAGEFRTIIAAAASDHNHFSKLEVSASTTIGSIDASAIKVTTTDVNLTLSGGVNGQGWDIVCPTTSFGISIPTGVTLYAYNGSDIGPTTRAVGGGRGIRIVRIDAATWIAPNLTW